MAAPSDGLLAMDWTVLLGRRCELVFFIVVILFEALRASRLEVAGGRPILLPASCILVKH